jgi:hypothetical protein
MHRSRAPSTAPGTFFVAQPWADCITNMQECQPATRAGPNEWIDWVMMYSLHDDAPQPRHSKRLRYLLGLVVEEFITGGPLYVREWRKPIWGGVLVARAPIPIIRLVHDTDPEDNTS